MSKKMEQLLFLPFIVSQAEALYNYSIYQPFQKHLLKHLTV